MGTMDHHIPVTGWVKKYNPFDLRRLEGLILLPGWYRKCQGSQGYDAILPGL
jgi:hypothetical protein